MTPLALTMQAFGPFAGCERLDFTALGEHPLFLINGPTGAGKSSILDAICFALYGQTTGDERTASQMRCDQADASLLTEVTLDFRLRDALYRIRRVPQQERPKARGEGTTTQSTEAQLWRLTEDRQEDKCLVAKSVSEATGQVQTLLGLDAVQFRQVMVLPQGRFRELLVAESKDREKIFAKLFQTHIFQRIEEQLLERSKEIVARVKSHHQHISGILAGGELESEAALEEEASALTPRVEQAHALREAAGRARRAAEKNRDVGAALKRQFAARDALANDKAAHIEQAEAIERAQAQLSQDGQAQTLRAPFDARRQAHQALQAAQAEQRLASEALSEQRTRVEAANAALDAARRRHQDLGTLTERRRQLGEYLEKGQALHALSARVQAAAAHKQTAEANFQRDEKALEDTRRRGEALSTQLEALQTEYQRLAGAPSELARHRELLAKRQELEALDRQAPALDEQRRGGEQTLERCQREARRAERYATEQEMRWHQGQAALLARTLQADTPCPVCGSPDHPAPAEGQVDVVTKEQVEQARVALENARQASNAAERALQESRQKRQNLDEQHSQVSQALGEWASATLAELEHAVRAQGEQAARRGQLESEITQHQQSRDTLRQEWAAQDRALKTRRAEMDTAREEALRLASHYEQLSEALPADARDPQALKASLVTLDSDIAQIESTYQKAQQAFNAHESQKARCEERLSGADKRLEECTSALEKASAAWREALGQSPFEDAAAFEAARLDAHQRQALSEQVESYRHRLAELEGALAGANAQLGEQALPDVAELEAAVEAAQHEENTRLEAWRSLDARLANLAAIRQKLADAHAAQEKLEAEYRLWGTLSDVANGRTGHRISLQRFVLGVLLDDVLIQASERLVRMSRGRYQLVRREDPSKGNKASGLELDVADTYTGKQRSVATLSGGESFMAALSLALGLSDVVQAYAGGIQLDTLFIDEGFGSLDQDALDQAIEVLCDLQMSGRMIGIISHVSELKEQMSVRIEVQASRHGSTTAIKGAVTT
ncbi:AAA family ATPase [Vreelandella sp. GE22]